MRVSEVDGRGEVLLDRPRADPAEEVEIASSLIIRAAQAGAMAEYRVKLVYYLQVTGR